MGQMDMEVLDNAVLAAYEKTCQEADKLLEQDKHQAAIDCFQRALDSLPEGLWACEAYAQAGKGEGYLALENWQAALQAFQAVYDNDQAENPYVLLQLGICHHELGQTDRAKPYLLAAYNLDGEAVFEGDEAYLDLIRGDIAK